MTGSALRGYSIAALGLLLTACGSGSTGTVDTTLDDTVADTGTGTDAVSTAEVECTYSYSAFNSSPSVSMTSTADWYCDASLRWLSANGIPDHEVGTFPNAANPNTISTQAVSASFSLAPVESNNATQLGGPAGVVGYILNGIKMDPGTGGSCNDAGDDCDLGNGTGAWRIEALGQDSFDFGEDENNAHVQPTGAYHYHGMPEGFITRLDKGTEMTLIGWAADGFPVYARFGYTDPMDANSEVKVVESSFRLKTTPDANRPDVALYAMGTFNQDYEYVEDLGDLDECNGRYGVTPEFPEGIYHYYATETFPFLQRCVKGTL